MTIQPIVERLRWDRPTDAALWQEDAPSWAKDPFNGDCSSKCGQCGAWLEIVRPGKSQCVACESDGDRAARWQAADHIESLERERDAGEARKNFHLMQQAANELRIRAETAEARITDLEAALAGERDMVLAAIEAVRVSAAWSGQNTDWVCEAITNEIAEQRAAAIRAKP